MKLVHLSLGLLLVLAGCCKQESSGSSPVTKTVESRPPATAVTATVTATAKPEPPKDKAPQPVEVLLVKAEANKLGKIQITDSTGKTFAMVSNEFYRDAEVASNQKLMGATIGGTTEASGTSLVIFDNHLNKLRVYPSPSMFVCYWAFWNNNTQIVLGGCPSHGPWSYSLVDLKTGKQVESFGNPTEDCAKTPKWAKVPLCN